MARLGREEDFAVPRLHADPPEEDQRLWEVVVAGVEAGQPVLDQTACGWKKRGTST